MEAGFILVELVDNTGQFRGTEKRPVQNIVGENLHQYGYASV